LAKKLAPFFKTNVMIQFLQYFEQKTPFFGEDIFF
jgi:hypothetical protein